MGSKGLWGVVSRKRAGLRSENCFLWDVGTRGSDAVLAVPILGRCARGGDHMSARSVFAAWLGDAVRWMSIVLDLPNMADLSIRGSFI
jgi:hypothetical protein